MGPRPQEPGRLKIVVCDTGPILHLREARALALLSHLGDVCMPPAVSVELARLVPRWKTTRPAWLRVRRLPRETRGGARILESTAELGRGEAEAIALAQTIRADWRLTDDAEARTIAEVAGLEVHGSLVRLRRRRRA